MSPLPKLRPGDVVAGRYVIEALLGESPAARIYLADENPSRQKLCLKVYRAEISSRLLAHPDFFPKAAVLPALAHDNLATVYEVQDWEGQVYVAREFLEGPSFDEWSRRPEHSAARGLEMLWQAAQALALFHEKARHGNVHPGNLVLSGFAAKLADPDPRMLAEGGSGTPLPVRPEYQTYIAPEIRRGGATRPASDLFSLAGMFFRLLTGAHPQDDAAENQRRLAGREREITDFLAQAMHADPDQRFPDAGSFADSIWALQPLLQRRKAAPAPIRKPGAEGKGPGSAPVVKTPTGTLFGEAPATPKASSRKPLSSLEADSGSASLFSDAPKTPAPAPISIPVRKEPARPEPVKSSSSLSSLEADSPDLTLNGGGASNLARFGFGDNPNQTIAIAAQTRKQSRKVLWISLAAAGAAIVLLSVLFIVLRSSAKKNPETQAGTMPETSEFQSLPAPIGKPEEGAPAGTPPATVATEGQPPFPEETSPEENLIEEELLRTVTPLPPVKPKPKIPRPQPAPTTKKPVEAKPVSAPVPAAPIPPAKPPVEDLLRAIQGHNWPATAEECLNMADQLNDYGRVAEANKTYSKSLEFSGLVPKERVHALGGMAVTFNRMGLKEEALNALDQLLAIQPGNRFAAELKAQLLR